MMSIPDPANVWFAKAYQETRTSWRWAFLWSFLFLAASTGFLLWPTLGAYWVWYILGCPAWFWLGSCMQALVYSSRKGIGHPTQIKWWSRIVGHHDSAQKTIPIVAWCWFFLLVVHVVFDSQTLGLLNHMMTFGLLFLIGRFSMTLQTFRSGVRFYVREWTHPLPNDDELAVAARNAVKRVAEDWPKKK